ncbi:ribose-5-phosphate isomerase RpiA [Jannaschia sp. Os4]|uniref:ribose-5-phosphate isomerase RpiA n=1 Tax=Jannaschia sp. Os4 TaxID=2807617 RepID=UPI00193AC974|nr:ribose-5-phosphate isomerase RpiA [Jannaschia sp. Os4]MBM2574821.1 ribose-5-phosphate isomerase RpiA [Jannaschia sp. Os4]
MSSPSKPNPIDRAKYVAALQAVEHVEDGMRVGLGTGSTAAWMVRALGDLVRDGLKVVGVPTSARTAALAEAAGIPLATLDDARWLDLTIDGADEFDDRLDLVKGGGGALLREKIVATASDKLVIVADASKRVETLGAFPLPVEVVPFGWRTTEALIDEFLVGMDVDRRDIALRQGRDGPFETEQGNLILDLHLGRIGAPKQLALALNQIPGVVETGLFLDLADVVVAGSADGTVEIRDIATGGVRRARVDDGDGGNLFAD